MSFEKTARDNHRRGISCAGAVYRAFSAVNSNSTNAPVPRSEGGKCGAVLAAQKILRETDVNRIDEFEKAFKAIYGSLKCSDLLGSRKYSCNDYVGTAASIAENMMNGR